MRLLHRGPARTERHVEQPGKCAPAARTALAWGALGGLAAALAMTLLMLTLRATFGLPTPAEMIGDRLTAFITIQQFFALLAQFGGYEGLKQAGGGGVIAGQLVVGLVAGVAFAGYARARQRRWPFAAAIVGVLWLLTVVLLWPNLTTNYRGLPPDAARMATLVSLLVTYGLYGLVLVGVWRFMQVPATDVEHPSTGRRAVLVGGVGAILAIATGGLLRHLADLATFDYDGLEYRGGDVQPITPNERFYTVTKNIVDPDPTTAAWRLEISGLVDQPQVYTFDAIRALPATTQETTLMCISNYVGGGLMSNAVWKGLPLRDLLLAAGPRPGIAKVVLHAADGYTDTYPLEKALEPTTFVAYEMNGEPLPVRHGYPVRILTPGLFGEKSVKWVTRIELVEHDVKGFYEQQGWGPNFVIPIRTTFFASDFATPLTGGSIPIRGNAFAGNRGIASVEVSADGGLSWYPARIDYPGTDVTWAFWTFDWQPSQAGDYLLVARATDRQGQSQDGLYRDTAPEGATGYPSLHVRATG
ncbi:MAG: molybdopterin-dependent oxidoreductase [Chloroflexi bacterium]|nr:molybdopterin-dependent oxidoreductase [Chloroflexota bacterium]MBV9595453.1 molybdopterin-dependent oxidoreductase [Chloroflexota bacterium]